MPLASGAAAAIERLFHFQADVSPGSRVDDARPDAAPGRRERMLDGGEVVLRDALAEKVLHGWLQNRHQTLYPLTVNFRSLDGAQRAALSRWMAVAVLAGPQPGLDEARRWLTLAGADAASLGMLDAALESTPALSDAMAAIIQAGVAPHAYVVALVVLNPADAATAPFLDFVAARLGLPSTVVRSATRRYRR